MDDSGAATSGRDRVCSAQVVQTSACSAMANASSTSIPRYRTVLSIPPGGKANGMSGFLLADGCPIDCHAVRCHVLDREADDITASKLAVDGKIEHCQVSNAMFDLELGPYRPDIFGSERRLRTDQFSLIPWAPMRVFAIVCNRHLHDRLLCCRGRSAC